MTEEVHNNETGRAEVELIRAFVSGAIIFGLNVDQTALYLLRIAHTLDMVPPELRGEVFSPELLKQVADRLITKTD